MTYDKALDVLCKHIGYLNGNLAMHEAPSRQKLHQALQAFEKFEGAKQLKEDRNKDVYWYDLTVDDFCDTKRGTYTLYAIPKENE